VNKFVPFYWIAFSAFSALTPFVWNEEKRLDFTSVSVSALRRFHWKHLWTVGWPLCSRDSVCMYCLQWLC